MRKSRPKNNCSPQCPDTYAAAPATRAYAARSEDWPARKQGRFMTAHEIKAGCYIGQRVQRKEDPRLLSGRGQFVDDISLPGMLHVAFARSLIARGNILSIRTDVAREVDGVHAILTQQDLARFKVDMINFFLLPPELPITPLAGGRVCYVGEPVALVIADSRHIAEDAASLIEIEYAEEDPVVSIADARHGPLVHAESESNIVQQ